MVQGEEVEGEYHLTVDGLKNRGRIFFKVVLFGMDDLDKGNVVENCYFEQRSNCEVCPFYENFQEFSEIYFFHIYFNSILNSYRRN